MKLYVGNLSYECTEDEIRELFATYGNITSVNIITDRDTGRSKGFAFVELENDEDGEKAISGLNDTEIKGRKINVSIARPKKDTPRRFNHGNSRRFSESRY